MHTYSVRAGPRQTGGHQDTLGGHLHLWCFERLTDISPFSLQQHFFVNSIRFPRLLWKDINQPEVIGSANKVLYSVVLLAFTYQEELSNPTWLPCQQESVPLRQVVLAGSTFESKKKGLFEKKPSCQPHFPQMAVT